ncbi:MAG TPA: GxxExxY protein [Chitinophagaceae bacterium]|nr:GxxExxY protein [Chitinophagaceae bacterium]
MELNDLTGIAVDIAFKLHNLYGPGLYEKVYEKLYCYELNKRKINYQNQVCIDLRHEDILFKNAFKADLILENQLLIELKSSKSFYDLHFRQLHTYLKISGFEVGLLFNFNVAKIKDGIIRVINTETQRGTQRHGEGH